MTLHEEQIRVQKAVSNSFAYMREDPWLTQRILANTEGEAPVTKSKKSLALVMCIVLILAVMGTAVALFSPQVVEFFRNLYGDDTAEWLAGSKIAKVGETITVDGVDFTLDEVAYRDLEMYAVGTAKVSDPKDVLLPMDWAETWPRDEGLELLQKAQAAGGRLLSVNCRPHRIGVDEGSMMKASGVGLADELNEDGTITFSFQLGGYGLEEGTTYQLELAFFTEEWTEEGMLDREDADYKTMTVSFEPVLLKD